MKQQGRFLEHLWFEFAAVFHGLQGHFAGKVLMQIMANCSTKDVASGLVHTVTSTAANVADISEIDKLLHGKEKAVRTDAGYSSASKRAPKCGRK